MFSTTISGAKCNDERPEVQELLEYVRSNKVDKVCVLSIDRLGRNTLEALKFIQLLNDNKVCLSIINYNLETLSNGKINPITSLRCTIFL